MDLKAHASHKGSHGQLLVLGGAAGMSGAAILAALAALHAGTGKVFLGLLNHSAWPSVQAQYPSLMTLAPEQSARFDGTVVCGCGGGQEIVKHLPPVLSRAKKLVLDADALNAIAQDSALKTLLLRRSAAGLETVLTPHPLEAARLLHRSVEQVQSDRLASAQELAQDTQCVVVLKGSGTVIAAPGQTPGINPSGHPRLAMCWRGFWVRPWRAACRHHQPPNGPFITMDGWHPTGPTNSLSVPRAWPVNCIYKPVWEQASAVFSLDRQTASWWP
jgi:hydroxyethylthiazole kinase-like uncharacterized protein yjeF